MVGRGKMSLRVEEGLDWTGLDWTAENERRHRWPTIVLASSVVVVVVVFFAVPARENIVGWYSTGPKIRQADVDINELFRKYHPHPLYVIIDVQPKQEFEIPTKSYMAVEEVKEVGEQ